MNYYKIYARLPYFFKVIAFNFKAFLNYKIRFNSKYENYLNDYIELWSSSIEDVLIFQKKQLIRVLIESYNFSDWYREIMLDLNISQVDIEKRPYLVLKKMPVLKKGERKKYVNKIVSNNPLRKKVLTDYTSGTSGTPTRNYLDKESIERNFAFWRRHLEIIGIKKGMKSIRFSGNLIVNQDKKKPPYWIYNYSDKQLFMSTYHLTSDNMIYYIKKIKKFKPDFIEGYPSAIYILSKYLVEHNIELNLEINAIIVTAETLYDFQREIIENAFKSRVYNKYASSEGTPAITECVNRNMHLNIDAGIFEFYNMSNEVAKPGEIAKLVVTSFKNFKTPLIRYEVGDTVFLPMENIICNCGCLYPVISKVIGREEDLLLASNGSIMGMMAYKIFKKANNIIKGQIIQELPNEITLNIEVEQNYSSVDGAFLISKVRETLGKSMNVKINILKNIPLGASGKFVTVKRNFSLN